MLFATTLPATIIEFSPIFTPPKIVQLLVLQTLSLMIIDQALTIEKFSSSCDDVSNIVRNANPTFFPSKIGV